MVTEFAEMGKLFVSWMDTRTRLQTFGETSSFWCSLCGWCLRASLQLQEVWCLTKARTCLLKFPRLDCISTSTAVLPKFEENGAKITSTELRISLPINVTLKPPNFYSSHLLSNLSASLPLLFKPLRDRLPPLMLKPMTDFATCHASHTISASPIT